MNIEGYSSEELSKLNSHITHCAIEEIKGAYWVRITLSIVGASNVINYTPFVVGTIFKEYSLDTLHTLLRDLKYQSMVIFLVELPFDHLPLLVTHFDPLVSSIVRYRLSIGK